MLCFGELLLRISPASHKEGAAKQPMLLYVGGAEANVATALAGWDVPVKYCTVLPDNFMSRHMLNYLEYKGIYTSSVLFSGNRIGVYYLERGADLKGNMVYDRDLSSFSELKTGMIDENHSAELTIFDPDKKWKVGSEHILSKSKNNPFIGTELTGKPVAVVTRGQFLECK